MLSVGKKFAFRNKEILRTAQCAFSDTMKCIATREPLYERKKPYDYLRLGCNVVDILMDKSAWRFDINTKLIIVEGPFGVGKKELAKNIAKAFDFHFEEDPCVDVMARSDRYGIDVRDIEQDIPHRQKFLDFETFLRNPFDERVHLMHQQWHRARIIAYIRALRHIFNTGQGVVMNRSVMSFQCVIKGMVDCGFLSSRYRDYLNVLRLNQFGYLKRPHVLIYLDAPYEVCMQRIRDRNVPYEADSKFFSKKLHDSIERAYKHHYLEKISKHAHLLVYDWTEKLHYDDVVMDMEKLHFHSFLSRFCWQIDWQMSYEHHYSRARYLYTANAYEIMRLESKFFPRDVPELWLTGDERHQIQMAHKQVKELSYYKGYNFLSGDTPYLKLGEKILDPLSYGMYARVHGMPI